jgi:Undecaprenyl-phosphate glucose phosphotransferase
MNVPLWQLRSRGLEQERAADFADPGAGALSDGGEAPKTAKAAHTDAAFRTADILGYGPRGKVTTSSFPVRRRGLHSILTARSIPVLAAFAEFGLMTAATFGAGALYHDYALGHLPSAQFYLGATLLLAGLFVAPCGLARDYAVARLLLRREQLRSVFLHWNSAFLLLAFALFLSRATDFYSRGSLVVQYAAGLATAIGLRFLLARLIAYSLGKGILGGKRVVVVGEAMSVAHVGRQLRAEGRGLDLLGMVRLPALAERGDMREHSESLRDIREAAAAVEDIARRSVLDEVIVSMPWVEEARVRALVENLATVPAGIHLAPDARAAWTHPLTPSRVGPLSTMRLSRAPLTLRDRVLKRAFDLLVGAMLLLLCLPGFALIGLIIKLDSKGPVFFRQRRHGFNQSEFRIFKFRTMTTLDDGAVIQQATRHDARITRIGRFLRRTNIDELPQLLNVLMGQMSLVGPRPHALAHNNEYGEKIRLYAKRHNVKPGITGLSQVKGFRGETDSIEKMLKRVEYDLRYIDNWSIFLDIKIMLLTIFSRKSFQNAY